MDDRKRDEASMPVRRAVPATHVDRVFHRITLLVVMCAAHQSFAAEPAAQALVLGASARAASDAAWSDGEPRDDQQFRIERVAGSAALGTRWRARVEYDFTSGNEGWRNVWVQYRLRQGLELRVGNQNSGLGLEESVPDSSSPFMERSTLGSLAPGRLTGAVIEAWNDSYTLRTGFFGDRFLENLGDRRGSQGNGGLLRFVMRPRATMQNGFALGGTVEYRNITDDDTLRLRARSESDLIPLEGGADTGLVNGVKTLATAGLEAAWTAGPVIVAGEMLSSSIERVNAPSLHPRAWSSWATWILTGQRRNYRMSSASFVEVPAEWPGALELAVRASSLDLDTGGIAGGAQRNAAAGLNWYPRSGVRLMMEYGRNETRRAAAAARVDEILQVRVQIEYGLGGG